MIQNFASDNCSVAHPDIVGALGRLPIDHHHSYGDDPVTASMTRTLHGLLGLAPPMEGQPRVFPVFTGTAANILALGTVCTPGDTVLTVPDAHVGTDEGGAAEALLGVKLQGPRGDLQGRFPPDSLDPWLVHRGSVHRSQVRMVSVSQTTELGGLYSPDQLRALTAEAHGRGLLVHLDGARLSQAVAAWLLATQPALVPAWPWSPEWRPGPDLLAAATEYLRAMSVEAGIDFLSLGATKNGALGVEAMVILSDRPGPDLGRRAAYQQKRLMQLGSKMRYLSAQLETMFGGDLWLRNALWAVGAAQKLRQGLMALGYREASQAGDLADHGRWMLPGPANALFLTLDPGVGERVARRWFFYLWSGRLHRLMCSWDTEPASVEGLLQALEQEGA